MSDHVQQDQPAGVPPLALTGERTLPDVPEENYWYRRHLVAYEWIADRVAGLRVADLACGEPLRGFRAAALGPRLVGAYEAVEARRQEAEGALLVELSHDGWVKRFGMRHERRLYLDMASDELRGEDALVPVDPAGVGEEGRRFIPFKIRFHVHPDVSASLARDGKSVLLRASEDDHGWWARLAHGVMRRPVVVIVVVTAALLAIASPFLGAKWGSVDYRVLPEDAPAHVAADKLNSEFGPEQSSAQLLLEGVDRQDVKAYTQEVESVDGITAVQPVETEGGIRERATFIPVGLSADRPVVSPDGKTLVFRARFADSQNLYAWSLDELAPECAEPLTVSRAEYGDERKQVGIAPLEAKPLEAKEGK